MPGFNIDRFADLAPGVLAEYTCSICRQILDTPVTTTCCLRAFCEDCINEWLQTNTTCPCDGQPLTANQLLPTPKMMVNTLDRFIICCDYWEDGCREMVPLKDLKEHTVDCRYKDIKCSRCQCVKTWKHDCIKALQAMNRNAETELRTLRMARDRQNHQILAQCRQHLCAPELLANKMSADMTDKTLAIIRQQLTEQNSLYLVCQHVVNQMELEFGSQWHCWADRRPGSST
ncbi:unnamed protein product, partial [Medioppia subpectinata]